MKLGGGYVNLREQLPLEGREGEAKTDALKYRLIEEEEGFSPIGLVVHANWLPRGAMTDGDVRIVGSAEGVKVVQSPVTQMVLYVFNSS